MTSKFLFMKIKLWHFMWEQDDALQYLFHPYTVRLGSWTCVFSTEMLDNPWLASSITNLKTFSRHRQLSLSRNLSSSLVSMFKNLDFVWVHKQPFQNKGTQKHKGFKFIIGLKVLKPVQKQRKLTINLFLKILRKKKI